ncbi:MAG: peroxidase [Acidobacteria bacterium]|nr:MAG: peroxidase [Acidobacteriota bacterium]
MARIPWYRFPVFVSLLKLFRFRIELRSKNLHSTQPDMPVSGDPEKADPPATPRQIRARTVLGTYNDLGVPQMGSAGQRFGRNVPLADAVPDPHMDDPNPRVISNRLLARETFVPATIVNLLAAAWIQFEVHDWMTHGKNEKRDPFTVPVDDADPWPGPRPMEIRRTRVDTTRTPDEQHLPPTYTDGETHWWDGSQIYGSRPDIADAVRAHVDGKLQIGEDGLLPLDPTKGVDRTGVNDNWWVGLSLLHTLFTLEHNAICDALQDDHDDWSDDRLYDVARLVNAALMAKIHTVEWTPAILPNPRIRVAMEANWWGLKGKASMTSLLERSVAVSGIVGSKVDHGPAPYAMTEEFTAVYRMHPLLPEELSFWSSATGDVIPGKDKIPFPDVAERKARELLNQVSMQDVFYSFGISHPGAIQLHNYPNWLRELKRPDGRLVDVAAVDIVRDRERGVPRYNRFRELLHLPRFTSFDELTENKEWADELRDVYDDDIDKVDALVGMLAETLPEGFGFSNTAFRLFILMASRRLQSDRFFTDDYRPEIYTTLGIAWVENTTMTDVILRHFPALNTRLRSDANAFKPWNDPENILKFRE